MSNPQDSTGYSCDGPTLGRPFTTTYSNLQTANGTHVFVLNKIEGSFPPRYTGSETKDFSNITLEKENTFSGNPVVCTAEYNTQITVRIEVVGPSPNDYDSVVVDLLGFDGAFFGGSNQIEISALDEDPVTVVEINDPTEDCSDIDMINSGFRERLGKYAKVTLEWVPIPGDAS